MDIAGGSLTLVHRPQLRDDVVEMMCKELLSGSRGIIRGHMGERIASSVNLNCKHLNVNRFNLCGHIWAHAATAV